MSLAEGKDACENCNKVVPNDFILPTVVYGEYKNVCPKCALKIKNETLGLPEGTPFQGKYALMIYKNFERWENENL